MSPLDTGAPRGPEAKRRMLPSVTDVVRDLAKGISADPAVLFKAARAVVGEELARVKQGFESAPLDVLVRRARLQLEREGTAKPVSGPAPPYIPVFPARPPAARETPKDLPHVEPAAPDEPFENAPSGAELGWEKEISIQPDDAPFQSAIIPMAFPPPRAAELDPVSLPPPAAEELESRPRPRPRLEFVQPDEHEPAPPEPAPPDPAPPEPEPPAFAKAEPHPEPAFALTVPLAQLEEPEIAAPSPARREPAVKSISEMPPLGELLDDKPVMEEFNFKAPEAPAPEAARSGGRGWLVAVALVLAIGVGLAWAVREYVFRSDVVKPARKAAEEAPPQSAVAAPVPAPRTEAAAPAVKPTAVPAKPAPERARPAAAAPAPKGRAALLLTPDWAGKPPVYVIHFSSLKDRESAAKEAKKLGASLGAPARAVEVDLGEKGVWYRVVLGEFADVDAARAFRADLEAKKTPGMGFVYEMRGR